MKITHSHIILDACCILNLCASGQFLAILKSLPAEIVVTTVVQENELKTLQKLQEEENDAVLEFETAITQGLLKIVDFASEEEEESFVNYAAILDDGEAATFAIAVHRKWAVATDDNKAIKFMKKNFSYLQILSTPEIIKHWSEKENIDSLILSNVLNAIKIKGHYQPPKNDSLRNWWINAS
jgi:predicted nucleic acid-binding protein